MTEDKKSKANSYRWCIWAIWIFIILSQYYLPFAVAPLLTTIMSEYALDYTAGGLLMTIVSVFGGLSMFAGGRIVGSLGLKRGALVSLVFFLVGDVISVVAPAYAILMFGRICIGVGYGIVGSLTGAMVMAWFPAKEQPFLNTANSVIGTLAQTAAFSITLPLQAMVGGNWHTIFTYAAILVCVTLITWAVLGKSAPEGAAVNESENTQKANQSTDQSGSLSATWKRTEVRKLTIAAVGMFMAFTAASTFFPSFLEQARGFDAAQAAVITGFMPMAGLVGSLAIGSLSGVVGLRRPFMWPMMALSVIGMIGAISSSNAFIITAGLCAVGFGVSAYIPMIYTYLMELPGATPSMVASGTALTLGVANIANLVDSFIYNTLTAHMGLSVAFIPFVCLLAVSLVVSLTLPETGPGRAKH